MALIKNQPHFVLLPYLAQGHLIPTVDIARLLAQRGVTVTILFTPLNYRKIQTVVDRAIASGLAIHVSLLNFPCVEAGLPEGCESIDLLPSIHDGIKFFNCAGMLKEQVRDLLINLKPSCLIADMCFPWATDVAVDLNIPRLIFHGTSCFAQVMFHMLHESEIVKSDELSDADYFVVPGLPDRIEITMAQLRGTPDKLPEGWKEVQQEFFDADLKAFGMVMNTFEELEPKYIKRLAELKGKKVWCIGPVSLCNEDELDKIERGSKASIDNHECLKWLDSQKLGTVIYVCLGSLSRVGTSQLIELGLALEASNHPFIWVLKGVPDEFKTWLMEENFEERVKTRPGGPGLLIHGWAPQVLILSHPSVGGFLTHCGWNSTMEGITAGLPMVTWPVFADQFPNEKFIVSAIKIGVRVGVERPVLFGEEEKVGVQVRHEEIKRAIDEVMDGGDEGDERRERVRKLSEMAKRAVTADGGDGSSYANITRLIQDVQQVNLVDQFRDDAKSEHVNCSQVVVK